MFEFASIFFFLCFIAMVISIFFGKMLKTENKKYQIIYIFFIIVLFFMAIIRVIYFFTR